MSRAINPRHNPTQETLNRLLQPFKLRLTLARIEPSKKTKRRLTGDGLALFLLSFAETGGAIVGRRRECLRS